jgi:hypothetical protein
MINRLLDLSFVFTNLEEDDLDEKEYREYKKFKEERDIAIEEKIDRDIRRTYRTSDFFKEVSSIS